MIKTMKALIQREFWEHRGGFIKTPMIVGIVILVLVLVGYIFGKVVEVRTNSQEVVNHGFSQLVNFSTEQLSIFWDSVFVWVSVLYLLILFIVLFFYMLGALYDDRKDGSILFWKSLPISDSMTVFSKLLTAMIVVPLVTTIIFVAAMIAIMILTSVVLLLNGQNPIVLVWAPANIIGGTITMLLGALVQMLWALPIYSWLLFCSAWKKTRPLLFAIFIPLIIAVSWYVLNAMLKFNFLQIDMFKIPSLYLFHAMIPYGSGNRMGFQMDNETTISEVLTNLNESIINIEILYGAIFATIFIAISIWVRRYRNTT